MTPKQIEQINRGVEALIGENCVGLKKRGLWYRPNCKGYTAFECDAGRYTLEEAKKEEYLRGDFDERVIITPFSPRNWFKDERTRPQLLAALSWEEKDKLCILALGDNDPRELPMTCLIAILELDQPTLARLFCAVKNIEIDL